MTPNVSTSVPIGYMIGALPVDTPQSILHSAGFFPYGLNSDDIKVTSLDDFAHGPIHLEVPVVLFSRKEAELYVSMKRAPPSY